MKHYRFDKKEIALLVSTLNSLSGDDRKTMQELIAKLQSINKQSKKYSKQASANILEMRKEDKLYARGTTVIQNHFNAMARKISKHIENRNTYEARQLYETMISEARLPKYEEQFNIALTTYLNEEEVRFLNREVE